LLLTNRESDVKFFAMKKGDLYIAKNIYFHEDEMWETQTGQIMFCLIKEVGSASCDVIMFGNGIQYATTKHTDFIRRFFVFYKDIEQTKDKEE
jgi:hypothetical protein